MLLPINIEDLLNQRKVESNRIEFKKGWNPVSIYHTICAFANDFDNLGGGYILVGVEEENGVAKRPVTGIPTNQLDKIQREILQYNQLIEPFYAPRISVEDVDGQDVLVIWVPSGINRPYTAPSDVTAKVKKPIFYIRYGTSTVEAKGEQLDELRDMANRVPFDDRGNPEIKLSDISPLLLKDYLVKVDSKLQNEDLVNDLEGVLEQMDLLEGPTEKRCIKNVAAMMFCEHPEKFFKTTQVDIVIFPEGRENNPDNIIELPTIKGSVPMMIRDAMSYLRTNVIKEQIKKQSDDEHSIRYFNYPYQALEEAVVNALYHRNYNEREPVEITVEPNRISILNHGGPDRSIPLDVVRKAQTLRCRKYRNRRLGEFLKELELTEGRATGIPTIQRKLKDNGSASATIETDEDRAYFLIDIPCHPDFVEEDLSNVVSQVELNNNEQLKQKLSYVVSYVMSYVDGANLEHIFKVFVALQKETSLTELVAMYGQTNRSRFKRTTIDILIQTGLATPTILDKPKSRNQKYVLTEAGRKLIKDCAAK